VHLEQLQNMPPQMTRRRTIKSPKQRLLDAAASLFCQHGINPVGIDAIVLQAGTAKTTLYKLFASKDRLVEYVLKAEGKAWRDWFTTALQRLIMYASACEIRSARIAWLRSCKALQLLRMRTKAPAI
jgi:AcrR family transcriptional regulator